MPGPDFTPPAWAPRLRIDGHGFAFFVVLLLLALVGEVLVLRPLVLAPESEVSGLDVVFGLVGGSFAIAGLVAWHKRPDSLTGVLMTATGFAFFVSPLLRQVDGALAFTVWTLLVDLWIFFYVPLLLLQVVWLLFAQTEGDNLLLAFPDEDVAHVLDRAQRSLLVAALAATVAVIAVRWWRATAPRRRALLPSVAGAVTLLLFAVLLVNDLVTGQRSEALLW